MNDYDKIYLLLKVHISTTLNMTKLYIHHSNANAHNCFAISLQKMLTAKYKKDKTKPFRCK